MGSVHKETESQGKNIHQYDNINYCDENVLRQLILHRRQIDLYYENRQFKIYNRDEFTNTPYAADITPFYEMIIIMYVDLDNLISATRLTDNQRFLVDKVMYGLTLEDFAAEFNKDIDAINNTFDKAIFNLRQQAEREWKLGLEWHIQKTKTDWKQCAVCRQWLPQTAEYFYLKEDNQDELHTICLNCFPS